MNVFEFLGLPKDHRKTSKVVQLVKHFDEVPDSVKLWPVYGQVKKDGVYCMLVVHNGGHVLFSRTGKMFKNTGSLIRTVMVEDIKDGVYIAELCCQGCSLEVLSGIVNPNRKKELSGDQRLYADNLYICYHDYLTIQEFIDGHSDTTYTCRYSKLTDILPIKYYRDVLRLYGPLHTPEEVQKYTTTQIHYGEEGAVFKPNVGWLAGHKGKNMMKKVRGVSYDLECIGYEEGKGKYTGKVANLLFRWKNAKTVKAMLGKGWTHEDAEVMFNFINKECNPIGKIFEVYALQESSKGVLRLPKVGELRHDKTEADF